MTLSQTGQWLLHQLSQFDQRQGISTSSETVSQFKQLDFDRNQSVRPQKATGAEKVVRVLSFSPFKQRGNLILNMGATAEYLKMPVLLEQTLRDLKKQGFKRVNLMV